MAIDVAAAIASIEKSLREATNYFESGLFGGVGPSRDDYALAAYYVERAIIELLILAEHLGLATTVRMVSELLNEARLKGLVQSEMGPEEPYLVWAERVRMFLDGISSVQGLGETAHSEMRDLKQIIKRSLYVICDRTVFPNVPGKESDVHRRIEAILKCHYPDLRSKPALSKPIKNFEPDTGIPSAKTLIEYKFVSTKSEARRVVDQILADASGYQSTEWKNLLFVIYETHRLMPEEEWTHLLRECGLGINYEAVVLSGDTKPGHTKPVSARRPGSRR